MTFCVLLAAGSAFWLYSNASKQQAQYEHSASDRADDYNKRSDVIVRDRCDPLAGRQEADCVNEERDAARQGYRDEYDLEAQRITATWTAHMGIAAIIGMAASLIGVGLVFVTFKETRKTAEISEKTYRAFMSLERPKLVVHMGEVLTDDVGNFMVVISVTNIGKTACVVTKNLWSWRKTANFNEVAGYLGNPIHILVEAAKTVEVERIVGRREIIDGTAFFGGLIAYQSPLAEQHRSFFCYQLIPTDSHDNCDIKRRSIKGTDWPNDD